MAYKSYEGEVMNELKTKVRTGLEIIGGKAESYAKEICPVDTGRLRNSITHRQESENTELIGTNVEYAPYVELGTHRQRAQPYLRPAAENHADEYRKILQDVINR